MEPGSYSDNPIADALYHVAEAINANAKATGSLLYGLKYSHENGLSIAEAIEVALEKVAGAVDGAGQTIGAAIEDAGLGDEP